MRDEAAAEVAVEAAEAAAPFWRLSLKRGGEGK